MSRRKHTAPISERVVEAANRDPSLRGRAMRRSVGSITKISRNLRRQIYREHGPQVGTQIIRNIQATIDRDGYAIL